ncbi:CHAT domain-containing protein [Candidatus Oscillochloris fontis]|uniref:VMAP-C domain-containing protein n=1 Tax=Candidatus Oscillochloris fontis TaxID=2496868 RepID=UPI00101C1BF5|nr:CHAT domain-containing protein [Candidatus Oscillochloris fontis]
MQIYTRFELNITPFMESESTYQIHLRIYRTDGTMREKTSVQFVCDDIVQKKLLEHSDNDINYGVILGEVLFNKTILSELDAELISVETLDTYLHFSLALDRYALELHRLHWEKLCHPETKVPLATTGRICFSRFLSSASRRTVHHSPRRIVRVLAAVAAPDYTDRWNLSPFNASDYLDVAQTTMGSLDLTLLGRAEVRTTFDHLIKVLRSGIDILYLVAYGRVINERSFLYLEEDNGKTYPLDGQVLAKELAQLTVLPRLVILVSCQSANPEIATNLATIFGDVGVPAVIAMQGNLSFETSRIFTQALLQAITNDEPIDVAVATGRRAAVTSQRIDWWMPVLFSRLSDGRLWQTEDLQIRSTLEQYLHRWVHHIQRDHLVRLADHLLACPSIHQLQLTDIPDLTTLCLELTFWDAQHTQALTSLDKLLGELGLLTLVTRHEILDLQRLVAHVHLGESDLDYLYGKVRPSAAWNRPTGRDVADTIRLIIQQLATAQIRMPEALHPLIEFVRLLGDTYPRQVCSIEADLIHWEQQITKRLSLQPRLLISSDPIPHILQIKITLAPGVVTPDISQPTTVQVFLDAWLFPDVARPLATRESGTLATALTRFTQLAQQAQQMVSSTTDKLWVEFLLPLELLPYEVDQWPIQTGMRKMRERPVGAIYPVVVRSLDRIEYHQQDAQRLLRWQQRWQHLQVLQVQRLDQAMIMVDDRERYCLDHIERVLRSSEEKVILLLTAFTFAELDDLMDLLDLGLDLGLPAVLLTRHGCSNATQIAANLRDAIAEQDVQQIPHMVQKQRLNAQTEDHIGHALTLLWDNPECIPPSIVYRNDQL